MKLKKYAINLLAYLVILSAFNASGCGSFWFLYTPAIPNDICYDKLEIIKRKILSDLKTNKKTILCIKIIFFNIFHIFSSNRIY